MADSRIIRNLWRRWNSPPDSEEVFVVVIRKTGDSTSLRNNSGRMLLHNFIGLVLVLRVCDGDFMVKVVVVIDKGVVAWRATVVCDSEVNKELLCGEVSGGPNQNKRRAKKYLFFLLK
jgi:hypothetical protein